MIAYPILNFFVLPLMLSSFIFVDNRSSCFECQNKTKHKVTGNAVIEKISGNNSDVNSGESTVVAAEKDAKNKTHKDTD